MRKVLEGSRFLVLIAVVGLLVMAIATFGWAVALTVDFIDELLGGGWRSDSMIVYALEAIDVFLLAIVQMIVAFGLFELFIGEVNTPDWLKIESIDDLKKLIIDVLVLIIAIKGIESMVKIKDPSDVLTFVGSASLLILALTVFKFVKASSSK